MGSSGFSVGNSVPADRRVTPPTELTGGARRVCPRQAAPAVLPSRTRSGGSRPRVGPDDGSPSQQGFTPRRGERSSGALDREGTGCRQLGAGRLGQRAVGASLGPGQIRAKLPTENPEAPQQRALHSTGSADERAHRRRVPVPSPCAAGGNGGPRTVSVVGEGGEGPLGVAVPTHRLLGVPPAALHGVAGLLVGRVASLLRLLEVA